MDEATRIAIDNLKESDTSLWEAIDALREHNKAHEVVIQRLVMSIEHTSKSIENLAKTLKDHLEEERLSYKGNTEAIKAIGWKVFAAIVFSELVRMGFISQGIGG